MLWSTRLFRKINALGKLVAVSSYKVLEDKEAKHRQFLSTFPVSNLYRVSLVIYE